MKNTKYRFRCIHNPSVIYTPEWMFDVEPMRKHPEYEEINADGEAIKPLPEDVVQTIPLKAPPAPVKGKKGK